MPKEPDRELDKEIGNPDYEALKELTDRLTELYDEDSAEKIEVSLKMLAGRYGDSTVMQNMYTSDETLEQLIDKIRAIYSENHEQRIRNGLSACIKDIELDIKSKEQRNSRTIMRGEIYYCELTGTVGSEASGERPVLIMSNNKNNRHSPKVNAVLLTTKTRSDVYSEIINSKDLISGRVSAGTRALTTDIISIEKVRLLDKVAVVNDAKMELIANKIKSQLDI